MNKIKGFFSKGKSGSKTSLAEGSLSGHGYDVKEKDLSKIHKSAWTGDLAKVKQFAKKDPNALDKENRTALHLACVQGHARVVQELLEWNVKTNIGDSHAQTPLMKAVECHQEECVNLLLEYRTAVDVKDAEHNTALHIAVREGQVTIVNSLIKAGADVNQQNKEGMTPLILSIRDSTKRDDLARRLLESGADPNIVDNQQRSALHHACTEDAINHVKLLLHYKANTGLKDSKGWTAEDCAMMKAHHGCCQVIFDHNLKSRPRLGSSLPATPRGGPGTATPMSSTTPRDLSSLSGAPGKDSDLFGHPQYDQDADEDSDDPTLSKHSAQDGRQDSWNEDTDISSAMDDHKLKGNQPKVSLTAKVKLSDDDEDYDDDDDELQGQEDKRPETRNRRVKSPVVAKFRKVLVTSGGLARPQYSRTPTPDADFRQSPNVKSNSKIPIKKQMSGASVEDEIFEDDDEDEEEVSAHRNSRVSFSNKQDIRNISATDEDDTDIDEDEEDEEEIVPSKKPKMSSPDEDYGEGYVPTGVDNNNSSTPNKLSQEQFQDDQTAAMMKDIGLDDVSDVSDVEETSEHQEEQPTTPRSILKKTDTGKPPSAHPPIDSEDDAQTALELADNDLKHNKDMLDKYKNEIAALKAELQRQRSRLTEENSQLSGENEALQARLEDLRAELHNHEEALTQITLQQNIAQDKLVKENKLLNNSLDQERLAREKNDDELDSIRTRLQSTTVQLEKAQQARSDLERRLHDDREEWGRQLERKDAELSSAKEKMQNYMHGINSMETKLNSVENELQISNTTLLERTNQYQQTQRDLQYYKTAQDNYDANFRHEKEQNAKLQAKIESFQDRLTGLQHENLTLKQQVDTAQVMASDRAGHDIQDKLNTMIASLKADHEKMRASLEEKNQNLQDTISRLRDEVRNSENRRSNLEQDIRRLNQEQNDFIRKHSMAEASLDVANKAREQLEQERLALKMEIEKLQAKYNTAQEKTIEAQTRMGELVDRLDRTEQSRMLSSQQLADTSVTMQDFNKSKSELEENYQRLQVENVRNEAELKHEKQKTEMLQRDLADSQKVRSSLEALCSNLKSTNAHLEEKLGPEQLREVTASGEIANRNAVTKEAEEHKGLWEQEVLSRSKLGLRIAQLDRHKQETSTQLEEEKRRTRKALQEKKLAETKLESEQEKSQGLQKEVANLKAYLKVAKKRLKALDTSETRISSINTAFDRERQAMEEMLISVKSQFEHMKLQLQDEIEEKERIGNKNAQLQTELKNLRKLEQSVKKIDRSKRKLEDDFRIYKTTVEAGYTEKSTVEEARREIEARYRLELNRKLDEVNNYLEEQARTRQKLDIGREEQDNRIRSEKKRLEEECTDLRIKYEQAVAKLETKELESKRFRDLYESEMQWRMRLSEQLYRSTDKAFGFKNKLVAERQKNRMFGSLTNLSMNGQALDLSKLNGSLADEALSNRLRAELDRSIAKHLEAAPHDQIQPLLSRDDPILSSSNFAKSSADYIEVLKRKYCV
ncbi:ankyrin repeat domain-containing protein 26-like isoform X5 [Mya arenaria]|uniref:ankyrin repeat domain-containing protein 26-like isoform X5 n=1 Tax=Mya arenaria TaxID=6604 RepID=UPI0022E75759|nr:ankyrin repeat domain-containing protein 26-like isoform X5 [Mya arenaria]